MFALVAVTGPAYAADRYVDDTGVNAPSCTVMASPCLTIGYALSQSAAGDTIHVAAGTYNENVSIGLNDITIEGAGAGTNPALHTILSGSSAPAVTTSPGINLQSGRTGITIRDLRIQGYSSNSGIHGVLGNNGLTIERVETVSNNTTGAVNGGGIYMNGPVSNVTIDSVVSEGNRQRGIVIWNGFKQNITITNCTVRNNNCCGIELQDGTASGVRIENNLVEDQFDSGMSATGLTSGAGANLIQGNTLSDNGRFGLEVKFPNGSGAESGDGSIVIQDNYVERTNPVPSDLRDHAGIAVYRRGYVAGAGYADIPNGVIVKENTVTGYVQPSTSDGFGIVVEGTNMKVRNNTVTGNDVGIQVQQGHTPYAANAVGDGDQSNLADSYFGRGNSPSSSADIGWNSVAGNGVGIRNVAVPAGSAQQACNWWNAISGPTAAANPGGSGATKTGNGPFAPWLIYGSDADAGTEGFQLPTAFSVAPTGSPNAADNNFTRLANAVQCAVDDQTVTVAGTFNWTEPNALARWGRGMDDVASTIDDYWIQMPADVDGVTLTATALGSGVVNGPGDLPAADLEGFVGAYDGGTHQDWTFSNLTINNFDLGIGLFCCGPGAGSTQYDGTTITNNRIALSTDLNATFAPADASQNIAIHFAFGQNQTISNNVIDIPGTGISDAGSLNYASSVGMQSNTSGGSVYDGLMITGNAVRVLGNQNVGDPETVLGFWENSHGHTGDVTIANNTFLNLGGANDPALNLQRGFRVTSHSGASSTVTYSGNSVSGANIGFQWIAGSDFSTEQPVDFNGNEVVDAATGVLVQSNGRAAMSYNRIEGATTAVRVLSGSSVDLECNVLMDNGTAVAAPSSGVTAEANNVSDNGVGIDVASDSGSGTSVFGPTNRIAENVTFGARNLTPYTIDATGNWWGCATGADTAGCDSTSGLFDASGFLAVSLDDTNGDGFLDDVCDPDSDSDGVLNASDNCPTVPNPGQADADGDLAGDACDDCPNDSLDDADGDGVCGDVDNCPDDANPTQLNADGDSAGDACESCPVDPAKLVPGACGCGQADVDTDGDLALDCNELCDTDAAKTAPGQCGCGIADTDADGDLTADCNDACPADSGKIAAGQCGCGIADTDTDGDLTADCNDGCPADAGKSSAGQCGCGVADTDTDGDLTADCNDGCVADAAKTAPGQCGCGAVETDTDGDTVADCVDACDNDPLNDVDGDGVCGDVDNCPGDANADQADLDSDDIGDVCDANDDEGALVLSQALLRAGVSGSFGKVRIGAVILDSLAGTLADEVATGDVYVDVTGGAFTATIALDSCVQSSAGSIRCKNPTTGVHVLLSRTSQGFNNVPDVWKLRARRVRLTEMDLPTGPVTVDLVQPTPNITRTDVISDCTARAESLRCREE